MINYCVFNSFEDGLRSLSIGCKIQRDLSWEFRTGWSYTSCTYFGPAVYIIRYIILSCTYKDREAKVFIFYSGAEDTVAQSQYWIFAPPPPPAFPLFQWVRLGLETRGPSAAARKPILGKSRRGGGAPQKSQFPACRHPGGYVCILIFGSITAQYRIPGRPPPFFHFCTPIPLVSVGQVRPRG